MSDLFAWIVLGVLFLAYANGANDTFKGVATLLGSGTTDYRRALAWAAGTTLAGSLLALILAQGLVKTFQARGLVPSEVVTEPRFLLAVSLGAAATVFLATRLGLPVSTTHALTGGLVGAGWLASQGDVRLDVLGLSFAIPLLVSPLVALALTVLLYPALRGTMRSCGITSRTCLCVGSSMDEVMPMPDGTLALVRTGAVLEIGRMQDCVERYQGKLLGLEVGWLLDRLHFLSAGAVGFARGLNDTPKLVALLVAGGTLVPDLGLALVAGFMAVGGVLNARRVADTLSQKIVRMNAGEGFTANLVTAGLVTAASCLGLPVSTTHVSVGSLFGLGLTNGTGRPSTIFSIVLAWVGTLPLAAVLGAGIYVALGAVGRNG